jgi:dTDP-4-amino-4,6-dideoxygalactose transaminase
MSSPRAYWLPAGLPFLHLGETRFHPLAAVRGMDAARLELLGVNVDCFRQRNRQIQSTLAGILKELAARTGALIDLPSTCCLPAGYVLLRYPLLLAPGARDAAYNLMRDKGLGGSKMYRTVLPEIAGLEQRLGTSDSWPAARDFARRLLTLPVHARVRDADMHAIAACLEEVLC